MGQFQAKLSAETIHRYIERRKGDLEVCRTVFVSLDFAKVETIGHQLKGNAATFGFPGLASVGAGLEKAGKSKDVALLAQSAIELERWLASVQEVQLA